MNTLADLLARLLRTARAHPRPLVADDVTPPFGFATRVAARWVASAPGRTLSALTQWERLSARMAGGLALAALLVTLGVWKSWTPLDDADQAYALESQLTEIVSPL